MYLTYYIFFQDVNYVLFIIFFPNFAENLASINIDYKYPSKLWVFVYFEKKNQYLYIIDTI